MNPPIVLPDTNPNSHRIISTSAIVYNIIISFRFLIDAKSCRRTAHESSANRTKNWTKLMLPGHLESRKQNGSRNHKASRSAKLNQARLDGEPHHRAGLALAADVVNACDEFTKGEGFLPAIDSHGLKCKPGNRADAMGCSPHARF